MCLKVSEKLKDLRSRDITTPKSESVRYFTGEQFKRFTDGLPKRNLDFRLQKFWNSWFSKILCWGGDFERKPVLSTLLCRNPLKMDTNIIDFPEIASSLRGHSSLMAERFLMSRHALERARGDLAICADLIPREFSARTSKSREKMSFFASGQFSRCAPAYHCPSRTDITCRASEYINPS